MSSFFALLESFNTFLWGYCGGILITVVGLILSFRSRWMQIFSFGRVTRLFMWFVGGAREHPGALIEEDRRGTSPLKAFFASVGGCIGIGNLVTISLAVKIGGPGTLVWIWLVALFSMILKYSEIYLGIRFRVPDKKNGYNGGPMYFLSHAFPKLKWLPFIMASLLCVYGVEIFVFSVVKDSISHNWELPPFYVMMGLLVLIVLGTTGGLRRMGNISALLIPAFVLIYCGMTFWILSQNLSALPHVFKVIFTSAFTGHAAVGGFLGSSFLLVLAKGFSAAAYSGDVGIGYASVIQAEARTKSPASQAALSVFGIALDTFIVTCTVLLVVVTEVWTEPLGGELLVQTALSQYFPYMEHFMPVFLFILGYTTILPYFYAGMKAARFIAPRYGTLVYPAYALASFIVFSFYENKYALTTMNIAGGLLMLINIPALYKLRHEVKFEIPSRPHL